LTTLNQEIERLWCEFAEQLGGFLRARVGDASVAEDIRQNIFIKLQQHIQADNPIQDFRAWIYRAARNATIDYYRSRKTTIDIDDITLISEEPATPDLEPLLASFRRMIHSLPDGYREAVVLADIEELPHKKVASKLGLSLPAAKSRILRGRQMLRESLDQCCHFERDRRGTVMDYNPKAKGGCREC